MFQTREERDSSELKGSAGGYGFAARIPLKDMAPGLYVLRVEAQSRLGDRPEVGARDGVPGGRARAMTSPRWREPHAPTDGRRRPAGRRCSATASGGSPDWLFLMLERDASRVRFHAAQSLVLFGAMSALLVGLCGALSVASHSSCRAAPISSFASVGDVVWLAARAIVVAGADAASVAQAAWRVPLVRGSSPIEMRGAELYLVLGGGVTIELRHHLRLRPCRWRARSCSGCRPCPACAAS